MKTIIFLSAALFALAHSADVLACSPPPLLDSQMQEISLIARDPAVIQRLAQLHVEQVGVWGSERGFTFGGNSCYVTAYVKYKAPKQNGMCPSFDGVEIINSGCPR